MYESNSFCNDSSCSYYRSNETIFDESPIESSRNFFCFAYINW